MPTFQLFKEGKKISELRGADARGLEQLIINNATPIIRKPQLVHSVKEMKQVLTKKVHVI